MEPSVSLRPHPMPPGVSLSVGITWTTKRPAGTGSDTDDAAEARADDADNADEGNARTHELSSAPAPPRRPRTAS